ncbi:protein suppressor of white apricot-like isoform X2 [Durio zibethinus]|uniref:Protein suppressor of white apricot-like isoform X2 n=1 Tax=Durio zibethinus TaxID=66656 RepID=A0A6P5WN33_DURZI|nr:protein suppressor of white apricot-like isoform X2 [Durio zibethinus]
MQPPTEKVHQIMARTAMFVSRHGGQSEIVLRVKQGDNPTFGFLMPDHPLHLYFRFLVDHKELLNSNSVDEESKAGCALDQVGGVRGGGALSLLGTVYDSGEDEEGAMENATDAKKKKSVEAGVAINKTSTDGPEQKESSTSVNGKDETVTKHSAPLKEKASLIKRNLSITKVMAGRTTGLKKESDASAAEKSRASSLPPTSKVELPVVEPSSDLKRVVDKIVEFILKNGRQFEAVLVEQDVKHGRFPFLLPSNLYHPYYLKVLQKAERSKFPGKGFISEKHDSSSLGVEKKAASSRESDIVSVGSDIPYDSDRKEKFKMVISKSKKDGQDPPTQATQPQIGISVDAAAAAAILQAATRGIKNPNIEILSKTSLNGSSQAPSSEGGHASSFGSLLSSQRQGSNQKPEQKREPSVSGPVANAIAKTAAIAAASEADSSEACLTKEEKLKAERLKRAKMFAAMIKGGSAPLKTEPSRGLSAELPESGVSGSGVEGGSLFRKDGEGCSVASDVNTSDKNEKHEMMYSGIDHNERRSKRKYRSRLQRHEEDSRREEEEEEEKVREHSDKKRRSHHSSFRTRDRRKHKKRHSSLKDHDSRHQHKHDSSSDDERGHKSDYSVSDQHHSRHRQKRDSSSDTEHRCSRFGHEHNSSSEDEHRCSRHCHRHYSSSEDENQRSRHRHKHHRSANGEYRHRRKRSHSGREMELEEGEICAKSDQCKLSEGNGASREASVDISKPDAEEKAPSLPSETTTVSNDLRAKIRAMLMATL